MLITRNGTPVASCICVSVLKKFNKKFAFIAERRSIYQQNNLRGVTDNIRIGNHINLIIIGQISLWYIPNN